MWTEDVRSRFMRYVRPSASGCWLWSGGITRGYARFNVKGADGAWQARLAHRIAYEIHKSPIPEGMVIDHLCRQKNCVNPDHLEAVTQMENVLRGTAPNAVAVRHNTCQRGHPRTPETTYTTRAGGVLCRICRQQWFAAKRRAQGIPLGNKFKTHCLRGHLFDAENTALQVRNGVLSRSCRTCIRANRLRRIAQAAS